MKYAVGDKVPGHFDPAIVAGSYLASFIGCELTVELLHRRGTGLHNLRSWCDTLMCATALGLGGIWCMHFIGNRAIILGDGQPNIQLVYSPGFSILSVVLPIIGLSIAFTTVEYPFRSRILQWVALICTGVFAGLSIVGMHYMGNFGISNYSLEYQQPFLAASITVAIGDCLLVLVLFYTLREKWISDWRKRIGCALFLAGGVSAMHFTAATNCIYKMKSQSSDAAIHSRNVQVAVASALSGIAVLMLLCVLLSTRYRTRVLQRCSQKIMLACAMFDPDGRILVTTEGLLPSREITDKFNPRTFDEDFDLQHPVFQWIFRVSRNWSSVSELIPKMKAHIGSTNINGESGPSIAPFPTTSDREPPCDYSIILRESFCVAAASLASSMQLRIQDVGVLYDNIVDTGTLETETSRSMHGTRGNRQTVRDLESNAEHTVFGRGQLLFLTRQIKMEDVDKLLNAGLKFGSIQQVGRNIAENMQLPLSTLEMHISCLKHYVDNLSTRQKSGTWLSCFAMIPKPHHKGFDVAVKTTERDQLPDIQLLPSGALQWQSGFLERMHDKLMPQCISFLEDHRYEDKTRTHQEQQFALVVLRAIHKLSVQLPSQWSQTARFYAQEINKEFGPLLAHYSAKQTERLKKTSVHLPYSATQKIAKSTTRHPSISQVSTADKSDASCETYEPVDKLSTFDDFTPGPTTPTTERGDIWGGMLASSETVANSDDMSNLENDPSSIALSTGVRLAFGLLKPEDTFVDELCNFARTTISLKASS